MASSLKANPNPVMVDVENDQTVLPTEVTYEKYYTQRVWHKVDSADWSQPNIKVPPEDADKAKLKWTFDSPGLTPGQIYRVRLYDEDRDPNKKTDEPRFDVDLLVFCLRKKPTKTDLFGDFQQEVGGTYLWLKAFAKEPVFMQVVVGDEPPEQDADGILSLREPIGSAPATPDISPEHEVEIAPLLPGNDYFAYIFLVNPAGNWQFMQLPQLNPFTTLERKTTIKFNQLTIANDGDPFANSAGSADLAIMHGRTATPSGWDEVKTFHYTSPDWEDGKDYPLSYAHVIQPEKVTEQNRLVALRISGVEDDGGFDFDSGEHAHNANWFAEPLSMPNGRGETVLGATRHVYVKPVDNDFWFIVRAEYSVEYE